MEIGTEISKKIRAAIKGKLQELGAYVDEELPDYIMVMVANKKTSQQMADDLSLFLGNNTIKFTAWLHGVLEKLRSVPAVEPASLRAEPQSDSSSLASWAGKSRVSVSEDRKAEESKSLAVSSSRSDRTEARVSSSAYENRRGSLEKSSSRLTSTVKPLAEPLPSEAVIDIKPELDDDLIAEEDPVEIVTNIGRARTAGRPTAQIYRPSQSRFMSMRSADMEGSSHSRQQHSHVQDNRSSRISRNGSSKQDEASRKRKAPVASSVVRVNRAPDEDSDDEEEEEDEGYGGRAMSSRVSLPSKPERRPSLPPAKQANRNLILKAISEAQDSITKTTAYPSSAPQRQTVPVAPRTRLASNEEMTAAIQLVQEHLQSLAPRVPTYNPSEMPPSRMFGAAAPARSLASRLQLDLPESNVRKEQCDYGVEVAEGSDGKAFDTRSFIMSRPVLDERQRPPAKEDVQRTALRMVQASKEKGETTDSASPKFIVTLDGVPSPLGNLGDGDMEVEEIRPTSKVTDARIHFRESKVSVLHRLQGRVNHSDEDAMDTDPGEEEDDAPFKKQRLPERCKFWPVCKIGDDCLYHHPTTQCKTFPSCKFGDKCLFVHPNCKYDARCSKPDCPFTHVSRRSPAAPPPRPVPATKPSSVCRFFPECKKMDCPFYHPKPCRFAAQCKRAGCTFYHPTTAVPPRHALKWTKAQAS